jgi:hypothetical protein
VLIETPEVMEGYLLRAQGCIAAVQQASRLAAGRGWLT